MNKAFKQYENKSETGPKKMTGDSIIFKKNIMNDTSNFFNDQNDYKKSQLKFSMDEDIHFNLAEQLQIFSNNNDTNYKEGECD
jgi:hypothetical protein